MKVRHIALAPALLSLLACNHPPAGTYTLYRSSMLSGVARIHMATFDTADGEQYNHENCDLAAHLFQSQDGVKTHFWCEAGPYRKSV